MLFFLFTLNYETLGTINESKSIFLPAFLDGILGSDLCSLPKLPGPCRGSFRRYFFNKITNKCEQFIYGGCRGNANNFASINRCHYTCSSKLPVLCLISVPNWFFSLDIALSGERGTEILSVAPQHSTFVSGNKKTFKAMAFYFLINTVTEKRLFTDIRTLQK